MDGLRFPKTDEKPPFQTWPEIERQIKARKLSKFESRDLWDCLFLTMPEIDACLRDIKEKARLTFMFPMLAVAAFTGARRSEILRLQIGDVDFTARKISIREKKRCRGRNTTRRVPMSDRLEEVLRNWLQTNAGAIYVFPSRGAGGNGCLLGGHRLLSCHGIPNVHRLGSGFAGPEAVEVLGGRSMYSLATPFHLPRN